MTPPKGSGPTPRGRRPAASRPAPTRKSATRKPAARTSAAHRPAARKPSTARRPAKAPARSARRHLPATRVLGALVATVLVVGFLLVAVFPTRTLLTQRSDTGKAQRELTELEQSNEQLTQRIAKLQTDAEVERIAREEHGMVRPGEEAYAVLPAPEDPVVLPEVWPFAGAADELNR